MSPRPAAPRSASVTACSTTSASEWPTRPCAESMRTPPRMSGRPSASRCESCPEPTRNMRGFYRRRRKPHNADSHARPEARLGGVVLEPHVLLQERQRDLARRAVPLLLDDNLQHLVVLALV